MSSIFVDLVCFANVLLLNAALIGFEIEQNLPATRPRQMQMYVNYYLSGGTQNKDILKSRQLVFYCVREERCNSEPPCLKMLNNIYASLRLSIDINKVWLCQGEGMDCEFEYKNEEQRNWLGVE